MVDNHGKHIKKKKIYPGSRIIILICSLSLIYFVLQAVGTFLNSVETISATKVIMDDSLTVTGYFIRDETVVNGPTRDTVEHVVRSGEKVRNGTQLAVEYTDVDTLHLSQQSQQLSDSIQLLQEAISSSGETLDTGKLDQLISIQMRSLAEDSSDGILSGLSNTSSEIRRLTMRRAIGSQDMNTLTIKLQELEAQRQSLQQSIGTKSSSIASPCNGYFSDTVDGYEGVLSTADIDTLTVPSFQALIAQATQVDDTALGKVMQGFRWYFVAVVPSESVQGLQKGSGVSLRFSHITEDIPVTIYALTPNEATNQTLLTFEGDIMSDSLISMRIQTVDTIIGSHTGIKIPKSAVYIVDGQMGVYTLSGSVSNFKPITPLYSDNNFYVIKQGDSAATGVVAQDDIIVKARGLGNNKVVKK